jgi:sugar phosphate isomerase/epimerase
MGRLMRRRDVLTSIAALALARRAPAQTPAHRIERIGLQLYTVRAAMQSDFEATLAKVAAVGYREVEFAGYFGRAPQQVSASLRRSGLAAPSAHVGLDSIAAGWERTLDAARTIGQRYLVVASVGAMHSLDDFKRVAQQFNRAGETAARAGIRFGYHNHDFEFAAVGAKLPYDVLLEETDPKYVCFEMDLYWITKAGQDPLRYFSRWPGRFELVHVKDAAGPGRDMVDVGAGDIDWKRLFAHGAEAGIRHYFVEHDEARDPFASIAASYAYLRDLRF